MHWSSFAAVVCNISTNYDGHVYNSRPSMEPLKLEIRQLEKNLCIEHLMSALLAK